MRIGLVDRHMMQRLRLAMLVESTTLVGLVLVAVPLKHLFGMPLAVRIMGPVHGTAFVAFGWALMSAVAAGGWGRREVVRLAVGSLIPFVGFTNERWLRQRERQSAIKGPC